MNEKLKNKLEETMKEFTKLNISFIATTQEFNIETGEVKIRRFSNTTLDHIYGLLKAYIMIMKKKSE